MKQVIYGAAFLLLAACGQDPSANKQPASPLRIAVAANAQYAADALVAAFQDQTGMTAHTMVASSGKLTAQIQQSAPYDLFLSADMAYPQYLFEQGLAAAAPVTYATGELILWTLDTTLPLQDPRQVLLDPAVPTIALAQARTAPYGQAAEAWLSQQGIRDEVATKLVFGESIAQVNSYLLSGAAQVAFTARSVLSAPALVQSGQFVALDPTTYPPLAQGMIITQYGQRYHPREAQQFYDFVLSAAGQDILRQFGYRPASSVPLPDHGEQ
jgi:molybdate transport system substrate-binding protein